ncbi:TRAP transporter large permease subunit [Oceanobacillus rekensis]|uniref:TRAP transporter large permease subunit n=1 Tax=Oceanobacillus rekensis TaxID=937927 RepID=UPI00111EE086
MTPPVCAGLYIGSSFAGVNIGKLKRAVSPFLAVTNVVFFLLTYVTDLVLWILSLRQLLATYQLLL